MSVGAGDFEDLLAQALAPVEPPEDLPRRMETALVSITELASGERDSWELSAMRNPRNWVRPAAAVVVGTSAGAVLVVLRVRARHHSRRQQAGQQAANLLELGQRTLQDVAEEARRILPHR